MNGFAVSFAGSIALEDRDINGTSEGEAISVAAERNIDSYLSHVAQQRFVHGPFRILFDRFVNCWRVPSSRLLFAGRSLALVVFEPRLHELVEFLHLFVGVGFWRAVFQPTEHVSFD